MTEIINVGGEKQLFIDDYCLQEQTGTYRQFHQAKKHPGNPILSPQEPWETAGVQAYGNVLYDPGQGQYRLWYNASYETSPGKTFFTICHATSTDGLNWQRSKLDRLKHNGMNLGNAVLKGHYRGPTILHTPDDPDPARRYRMLVYTGSEIMDPLKPAPGFLAYSVMFSADGLNWEPYKGNPVLQGGDIGTCCYDPITREYLAFHKVCRTDEGFYRRCAGVSVSTDFLQWSAPIQIVTGDPIDDARVGERMKKFKNLLVYDEPHRYNSQIYGMTGFRYEGLRLGLIWLYDVCGYIPEELGGNDDGIITPQLVYSRATCPRMGWTRAGDREDFIPCGEETDFDAGMTYASHSIVERGDELWFYYNGTNRPHGWWSSEALPKAPQPMTRVPHKPTCIGLATLRRDGFASMNAYHPGGKLTTKLLTFSGASLEINADSEQGKILVELQDAEGQPIAGFEKESCVPFRSNSVRGKIEWKSGKNLTSIQTKPVRVVFHLQAAKLFAFKFLP